MVCSKTKPPATELDESDDDLGGISEESDLSYDSDPNSDATEISVFSDEEPERRSEGSRFAEPPPDLLPPRSNSPLGSLLSFQIRQTAFEMVNAMREYTPEYISRNSSKPK